MPARDNATIVACRPSPCCHRPRCRQPRCRERPLTRYAC
jgi:hypothetical protein